MVKQIQLNKSPLTTTLAQQKSNVAMLTAQELAKLQKLEELLEPCRNNKGELQTENGSGEKSDLQTENGISEQDSSESETCSEYVPSDEESTADELDSERKSECLGFFMKKDLWKHSKTCRAETVVQRKKGERVHSTAACLLPLVSETTAGELF
ncbi:hypothetical protein QQF64_023953 [Cirrhinus molitorella]|uniref:Uncharacterized protein n=1 Tax=Cirrhinus molitorella TaxID=172907 RepID=A0ABR3NK16_9TELE